MEKANWEQLLSKGRGRLPERHAQERSPLIEEES